ncbi:SPK domain-containing protein [Caenorhabditis elegans]|uniref:SPK domain-containing protein n=1 Tax=Caenorhabditis elegans TaxID=6239 RepID=Q9NA87_CAEEL|nr:SPK domain-containing protein [Caenorhabditis elegans]CAB55010.1 SPK domain-containing protein [Caenorhabditis elegans]|eukprot:NP_496585.1 Uncharacterized protein CELE_Y57A10A.5 [Caenorhabditis elegans]
MAFIHTSLTRLMRFAVDQTKDIIEPLVVAKVLTEFSESENDGLSCNVYYNRFHEYLAPIMAKLEEYRIEERVLVMFGFAAEVSNDFRTQIRTIGDVELDDGKRICKFTSYDGKLKLQGDHNISARPKKQWPIRVTPAELTGFMNYLVEKTKDTIEPVVATKLFREFSELEGEGRTDGVYYKRFYNQLAPNMAKLVDYSIEERLRVMFGFAAEVFDDFLAQIRTLGDVELDEGKRISKFTSTDGKLNLEGDHSHAARMKRKWAAYRNAYRGRRSAKDSRDTRRKSGRKSDSESSDKSDSDEYSTSPKRARASESDDDEYIGAVNEDPEHRHFDDFHIDHSQNYEETMVDDDNQPIPEDPPYESDEVEGQPKPEPIDFEFDQTNNRDVSHSLNINNLRENGEVSNNPSISEIKVDFPFFERQQFSVPTNNGATSAESRAIYMHDFLKEVIEFICFLERTELIEIKKQIKKSIGTDDDKNLQITDIRKMLESFFFGISRKIRSVSSYNSTSSDMLAKDFLLKFKLFLLGLDNSELIELQRKVQAEMDEPKLAQKILLDSDVRQSLQNLLFNISH